MDRRAALAVLVTGTSGCLNISSGTETSNKIQVKGSSISADSRSCTEEETHSADVMFDTDNKSLSISGEIVTTEVCDSISISLFSSINDGSEDVAIVSISSSSDEECSRDCAGAVSYTAHLVLTRLPSTVRVEHNPQEGESSRVGVFANETMKTPTSS